MKDLINKIHNADCIEFMKKMPENFIDTLITDPPYGIGFMGKEWDNFNPMAVKKATASSSRKKSYLNPSRSKNVRAEASPALEAGRYDRSLQGQIGFQEWMTVVAIEMLRVTKPGGTLLMFGGTRTYHRMACAIEDAGWVIKDCIMFLYGTGFPKATDISKQLDKGQGLKRTGIIKKDGSGSGEIRTTSGRERQLDTIYETGKPISEEAQLWNGWKSHGLKPAYEPIIVAMKPNEGTYANNALKWKVSGLNIDGGRIGTDELTSRKNKNTKTLLKKGFEGKQKIINPNPQGRFPSNIILDEEAGKMLGEPSRFFYTAKATKAERNAGCEGLEEKITTSALNTKNGKGVRLDGAETAKHRNNHPTVKPLALMEYLCTLTKTPTGGVVLDPFAGSGSTLVACQNTGRDFIGIEKEAEYCKIAEARLKRKRQSKLC